ncbi:MAG TPA: heme o synthase [Verrucomicrobiae bacterium]
MKATVQEFQESTASGRGLASVLSDLFKARLTALVVLTTLAGFYMGSVGPMNGWLLLHSVLGTALLAAGAAALNQLLEHQLDARMQRTEGRPIPAGQLRPDSVLMLGAGISAIGLIYLAFKVNLLTSVLGAATLISYLFIYTPLKRITPFNTIVGAIPGALPPLMGWTAARNSLSVEGWTLFAILFFWQLPHFLAIAWLYREDYAKAGFQMLPVVDQTGERTARSTISHTLGLLPISLCPFLFKLTGPLYFFGAFVLSLGFLYFAIRFARDLSTANARKLFLASIIYLPLLLGLMVFDKVSN